MQRLGRIAIRALLWLTIAVPATWLTLWLFERLIKAGVFGHEALLSTWPFVAGLAVALLVGNAIAYRCDRFYVRLRARSRPLGARPVGGPAQR